MAEVEAEGVGVSREVKADGTATRRGPISKDRKVKEKQKEKEEKRQTRVVGQVNQK